MVQEKDISTEDAELIQNSGYFDINYYLANYGKELNENEEPLEHFLYKGWQEGKNPSEKFNVSDYLEIYKEVQEAGVNPLLHYLRSGKEKEYSPNKFVQQLELIRKKGAFDEDYYLKHYAKIIPSGEDPLHHL